jgi:hypothetical protein
MGHFDEPAQLIHADRPPIVAAVFLGVVLLDAPEGVLPESMGIVAPLREGTDCRRVVIARRQRPAFLPESPQSVLDALGGEMGQAGRGDPLRQRLGRAGPFRGGGIRRLDLRQGGSAEQRNDPARPTEGQRDVRRGPALVRQVHGVGFQVFRQRPGFMIPAGKILGVD